MGGGEGDIKLSLWDASEMEKSTGPSASISFSISFSSLLPSDALDEATPPATPPPTLEDEATPTPALLDEVTPTAALLSLECSVESKGELIFLVMMGLGLLALLGGGSLLCREGDG